MYIITNNLDNVFMSKDIEVSYQSNGNIVLGDIAYPPIFFNLKEVGNIPEEVEPYKYCYTDEKGFYINEDYVEPKIYSQAQYDAVIAELVTEGRL